MKPSARRKARKAALQALYQILMAGHTVLDIEVQYVSELDDKKVDIPYFQMLINGVAKQTDELDALFSPYLDRNLAELTPIELCVLRMATFELKEQPDVPYKVVINEALELTKKFGATEAFKFINGVLDKLAPKLRSF